MAARTGYPPVLAVGHASQSPIFGAERSLLDVIKVLDTTGYEIHAVFPHDNPEYFEAALDHASTLSVFDYRWWRDARPLDEEVVSQFAELIRELEIGVVHVNTVMLPEPLEAARRLGITSVVHVRENLTQDPYLTDTIGFSAAEIVSQVRDRADYVIGNSDAALRAFDCQDLGFRVYNGVDVAHLDIENPVSPSAIRVGLISSNVPKKGLDDFVRLAKLAEDELPQVRFVLIGPENEHVARLLGAADMQPKNLEVAGYVRDPRSAIERVNIVMNLSNFSESFGRTVAEGMAARRPVIVYDHGALPELVRHEVDGFVLPYRDYGRALDPLRAFCERPELIREMGEAARSRCVELFSKEAMATSLTEAYRSILSEASQASAAATRVRARGAATDLRVAYFLWHFPVPSETFVLNELRALVQQGVDVRVYCRRIPHPEFRPDFPIDWEIVETPEELAGALASTGRELVHSHFTFPTVTEFVWPACEAAEVPFTFIAHSQDIFRHENEGRHRIDEIARSPFCRKIFVPGRFHHDFLVERGVPHEKLMISPQLSDAAELLEAPGAQAIGERFDRRRLCAVQRLVEKKGLAHLVEAAPALRDLGVEVDIYGYGPLHKSLQEQIDRSGVTNVRLCGPVESRDALVEVFSSHDALIAPSVRASDGDMDGVPTVLMEAMGTGLPVLSSRISSVPDLIRDGVNGLLFEPGDARAISDQVARFYGMPEGRIRAIAENARHTAETAYGPDHLMGNLLRQWRGDTIDLLIVAWNNLPQLTEVIERLFRYTTLPFRLIVCDNGSDDDVASYLDGLAARHSNVKVVHKGYNSYVGPGTNTALEAGSSPYAIYVCGKEGFVTNHGWEVGIVEYMDEHPEVGLAGSLCYSPSYMTGRQYVENHPRFSDFRNPDFALDNPDRTFRHVQGGVFAIRRAMYESIGGFSDAVPHEHTDTEYSYYAESRGWRLGEAPGVLSLYNKTRPGILSRLDENAAVVHPGTLGTADLLDQVASGSAALCNLCEWEGSEWVGEDGRETCPACGSEPAQRTVYRYLADSMLTYRRLRGFYVNPHPSLAPIWQHQFRGRAVSLDELEREAARGADRAGAGSLDVVYVDDPLLERPALASHLGTALSEEGVLLIPEASGSGEDGEPRQDEVLAAAGLVAAERRRYRSSVVRFDWRALLVCRTPVNLRPEDVLVPDPAARLVEHGGKSGAFD